MAPAPAAAAAAAAPASAPATTAPAAPDAEQQRPREKLLLLIIDGAGDVTIPAFGDRTPLQVAHTPNLDALAGAARFDARLACTSMQTAVPSSMHTHTPSMHATSPPPKITPAAGLNGLMDSVEPGLACGSDTSHMNILGYDPRR
jgi:2,3-bisphosphoglycerate-independent phosphoglycerate mutase